MSKLPLARSGAWILTATYFQDACSLFFCSNHKLTRVSEETPCLRATDWIFVLDFDAKGEQYARC
jgi:hypothetical protein